jgi:hypothetical protein
MRAPLGRGETRSRVPDSSPAARRTGGVTVGLACLGVVPRALADPAELGSAHRGTYAALLRAIDAGPAYEIEDVDLRATMFAEVYADGDDAFRAAADTALDALEAFPASASFSELDPGDAYAQLEPWRREDGRDHDLLTLVELAFPQDDEWHQILFAPQL